MFKNNSDKTLTLYQINNSGFEDFQKDLICYVQPILKAVSLYYEFNNLSVITSGDNIKLMNLIDKITDQLYLATYELGNIGSRLGMNLQQLSEGLDHLGIELGTKTPSLFVEDEEVVDKIYNYANLYRNKYLISNLAYPDMYQTFFKDNFTYRRSNTYSSNSFFIYYLISCTWSEILGAFLDEDKNIKFKKYRELCIMHCLMVIELQQHKTLVGW